MLTFTLAISCLTNSNLPWFMDLTFQVPMQYCSLQHQTLLLSPVPSTAGYRFCFGSIPSFFLELFLHWSPVAYWAPTNLGGFLFQYPTILPFHTVHGVRKARILKRFARSKTIPMKKKCKKAKWLSEEALQIAVKREAKSKGENERYKHLNAEFQRIARRDKKAFLSDQCKEIEKTPEWERLAISSEN